MRARVASLSRSPWFRIPTLLFGLFLAVVMGPWMVVAVLAASEGLGEGQWLLNSAIGAMGLAGLLGLVGLLLASVLPGQAVDRRPALSATLATLLGIGIAAALVGAIWSALGEALGVALGFGVLSMIGVVLWVGVFEGRRGAA